MAKPDDDRQAKLAAIERQTELGGRFEQIARIGVSGGDGHFSILVGAYDRFTKTRVALKFFDPIHRSDAYRWECFNREANMLEQLVGEPDIVRWVAPINEFVLPFTHFGITLNVPFAYYALELASGDVGAGIAANSCDTVQKMQQFRAMCRSVQRIHGRGIAHRDLKPSNFLTTAKGEIRLSDFGTAKHVHSLADTILSRYVSPVGDTMYAAPELFAALHDSVPSISLIGDIYALGAILFELFSGTALNLQIFDASTLSSLTQVGNALDRSVRVRIYNGFISKLKDARPLPKVASFVPDVPGVVADHIDRLYMSMASLDYNSRMVDFQRIFARINQIELLLRTESKYREWKKRRDLIRSRAAEKREQRISILKLKANGVQP